MLFLRASRDPVPGALASPPSHSNQNRSKYTRSRKVFLIIYPPCRSRFATHAIRLRRRTRQDAGPPPRASLVRLPEIKIGGPVPITSNCPAHESRSGNRLE